MGIFSKVLNKSAMVTGPGYQLGHSISASNIFGTGGDKINVLDEYSGYVWKAINVRSEELAAQSFFVERKVGDKWQADDAHEFNRVIDGEDGGYDESELYQYHQTSLDIYGESFWYFSKGERSRKPFSVYLLDPSAITVMIADSKVTGYVYQKDNERITFDLDEIAHFRAEVSPQSPYRGIGPMQKAGWFIRSNRYAVTYVNNFLENNGIPAGVVVAKSQVDDKDWELFKQQWKSNYGGVSNAGKTAFVRGQDLDFVKTGISLGEVDFDKVTKSSRDDILAMFSVPKSRLGIFEDYNLASATTAEDTFLATFTKQAVKRVTNKLSRKVSTWYGPQYRYGSDFELPENREIKLQEYEKGTGVWITVNEAREAYGLPKLGSEFDKLTPKDGAPVAAPKSIGKVIIRTKNNKAEFSYEMKESFRSETEDLQVKYEKQFVKAVNPILKEQKQMVLDQIAPKKAAVDTKFDVDAEAEKLNKALLPIFLELAEKQGLLAIKFAANDDATFELTPVIKKTIQDSIEKANLGFTEETQKAVAETVASALESGDSIADISKAIDTLYKDVLGIENPGYRLERISRTEIIKASNEVTEAAYRQSGVVQKKEWFANPGHCQFCAALNGSILSLGASFVPEGSSIEGTDGGTRVNNYEDVKHPPIHPQCRCTLIPVIEG